MADPDDLLRHESAGGDAIARSGLWLALGGAVLLTVIGLITLVLGYSAGPWVMLVGLVCALGAGWAIRHRRQ